MTSNKPNMTPVGSTARSPEAHAVPAVLARHVDEGRRRELAHALHQPLPRAPRITERIDEMRTLLARYRAEAIALHARLVALELAGNDNVAALRRALIESSVQIENLARSLVDPPGPVALAMPARWSRGTEQVDEWGDQPTLKRER